MWGRWRCQAAMPPPAAQQRRRRRQSRTRRMGAAAPERECPPTTCPRRCTRRRSSTPGTAPPPPSTWRSQTRRSGCGAGGSGRHAQWAGRQAEGGWVARAHGCMPGMLCPCHHLLQPVWACLRWITYSVWPATGGGTSTVKHVSCGGGSGGRWAGGRGQGRAGTAPPQRGAHYRHGLPRNCRGQVPPPMHLERRGVVAELQGQLRQRVVGTVVGYQVLHSYHPGGSRRVEGVREAGAGSAWETREHSRACRTSSAQPQQPAPQPHPPWARACRARRGAGAGPGAACATAAGACRWWRAETAGGPVGSRPLSLPPAQRGQRIRSAAGTGTRARRLR